MSILMSIKTAQKLNEKKQSLEKKQIHLKKTKTKAQNIMNIETEQKQLKCI